MVADGRHAAKLKAAFAQLGRGKNVQNRQLRTLLGEEGYARFLDDWQQQKELRETLADKPDKIVEYEQRLKNATFAYSKADAASGKGRHKAAKMMFAVADRQFERLAEFLREQIASDGALEMWFGTNVHFDASNVPISSPDSFPCVVTSRSLRNTGVGILKLKRTKRQVKIDAVERALENLGQDVVGEQEIAARLAAARKLNRLMSD